MFSNATSFAFSPINLKTGNQFGVKHSNIQSIKLNVIVFTIFQKSFLSVGNNEFIRMLVINEGVPIFQRELLFISKNI